MSSISNPLLDFNRIKIPQSQTGVQTGSCIIEQNDEPSGWTGLVLFPLYLVWFMVRKMLIKLIRFDSSFICQFNRT